MAGFDIPSSKSGSYERPESQFRHWISKNGEFPAESGRYHLIVSYACPWACRTLAYRAIFGLEDVISVSVVHPVFEKTRPDDPKDSHFGWAFKSDPEYVDTAPDSIFNATYVRDVYDACGGNEGGRHSVPILVDKKTKKIVNNESSDIIRMINSDFRPFFTKNEKLDMYPESLRREIDSINEWVYPDINNGVYMAGFAKTQEAYEGAAVKLFKALERAEKILAKQRYLASNTDITEADIRLFVTLVRFDAVYNCHFKCTLWKISERPVLHAYLRDVYQFEEIGKRTAIFKHFKDHYYKSHANVNPYGLVPIDDDVEGRLSAPHDRASL